MNKYALIGIITLGVIGIALFAYVRDHGTSNTSAAPIAKVTPTTQGAVITYTDSGFSPASITVKAGTIVTFANMSGVKVWPASGMHPTHTEYPTTGGCIGSTFDACTGILPGASWQFRFDAVGTWNYHDHLHPENGGIVIVE